MADRSVPKFTRRDFRYIADIIAELRRASDNGLVHILDVEEQFTSKLRYTNPNFREDTFREACSK